MSDCSEEIETGAAAFEATAEYSPLNKSSISKRQSMKKQSIKMRTSENYPKKQQCDKQPGGAQGAHHFRIDWRQLTYFKKDSTPPAGRLASWLLQSRNSKLKSSASSNVGVDIESSCLNNDAQPEVNVGRKRILNSLDGCFKSGQLSAILGPSGAGKSTFLSALFGNKQEASFGHTKVTWLPTTTTNNDNDGDQKQSALETSKQQRRRAIRIASLPQQDHLLNHLTVYESLMFASKLKNPHEANNKHFHSWNVRRVAKMLKLSECFETRCGRLSGGQYKRVSIGQELLSEPDVIILDEPTSGLDAMTCLTTIKTLKAIVMRHPISIVLTIHQPDVDVFNLFDHVYVIAQGGMAIYEGPPGGVASAMAKVNLFMPTPGYNPARFIVENAFLAAEDSPEATRISDDDLRPDELTSDGGSCESECESDLEKEDSLKSAQRYKDTSLIKRSLSSITEALGGNNGVKPLALELKSPSMGKLRDSGRKPLLNLAIQTSDGRLITSDTLALQLERQQSLEKRAKELASRLSLLSRLNELQKARYYGESGSCPEVTSSSSESGAPVDPETLLGASSTSSVTSAYSEARDTLQQQSVEINNSEKKDQLQVNTSILSGTNLSCKDKLGRNFDKRLSAKHGKQVRGQPTWQHVRLLTHRTWLSIVRDPVFFGIQFAMHTTIPLLLALIFGSQQEEGCPQVGNFDLVEFAYQPNQADFIHATMHSIRQSIGNIGIIFFEMFVLSFAINCITALVFPLDMFVLLKEHRNGWYSLRAYFFGRTLADLPVPIVLHSMAMAILYYLTGQPLEWWRFGSIVAIVILASLVAQSVGLTIGALLMRSSQSAVLAAAGIVAPFFALSGFIVRIHTLPWAAQLFAKGSYLYHLLNGFIIMRYGFDRCQCKDEHFEPIEGHQIPHNLKTMASMWIGTYSNEFPQQQQHDGLLIQSNRTNVDPNIDIIDKLMGAFKVANSFGHKVETCADVLPYAMLDFNLKDSDIMCSCAALLLMLIISRFITFSAIYYKIRSYS